MRTENPIASFRPIVIVLSLGVAMRGRRPAPGLRRRCPVALFRFYEGEAVEPWVSAPKKGRRNPAAQRRL